MARLLIILLLLRGALAAEELPTEGTKRMGELLARIQREANPLNNPFLSRARAEIFAARVAEARNAGRSPHAMVNLHAQYGMELLDAGRSAEAITELETALSIHRSPGSAHFMGNRDPSALRKSLAMAHLRLGEQENCVSNHTTFSCILPIDKSATHRFQRGSRGAIKILLEQLKIARPICRRAGC